MQKGYYKKNLATQTSSFLGEYFVVESFQYFRKTDGEDLSIH